MKGKGKFTKKNVLGIHQKNILNTEEACEFLSLKRSYLHKLTSKKAIPYYKPNNRYLYFLRSELEDWLLQNRHATQKELDAQADSYLMNNSRK